MEKGIQMTTGKKNSLVPRNTFAGFSLTAVCLRLCAALLFEFVSATETIRNFVAKPEDFRYA